MEDAEDFNLNSIYSGSCMLAGLFSDNPEVAFALLSRHLLCFLCRRSDRVAGRNPISTDPRQARSESDRLALSAGNNSVSSSKKAELDKADLVKSVMYTRRL